MIGKYVEKFFRREQDSRTGSRPSGIDEEMLRKHGFGE
jgi:hypothetical protein